MSAKQEKRMRRQLHEIHQEYIKNIFRLPFRVRLTIAFKVLTGGKIHKISTKGGQNGNQSKISQ